MLKMVFVTDVFCQGPQSSGTTTSPPHSVGAGRQPWAPCEQTGLAVFQYLRGWHGPEWACGLLFAHLGLNDKHQIIWVSL